jgi:hypothetical protein
MNSKSSRAPKKTDEAAGPRKRFRIEKLEERIAPSNGGKGTHNCGGSSTSSGSFSGSIY